MSRLIDADALMKEFAEFVRDSNNSDFADVPTWNDAVSLLGSAPTIEPKKGTWYEHYSHEDGDRDGVRCSECGTHYYFDGQLMNYCPNCGADMREGECE